MNNCKPTFPPPCTKNRYYFSKNHQKLQPTSQTEQIIFFPNATNLAKFLSWIPWNVQLSLFFIRNYEKCYILRGRLFKEFICRERGREGERQEEKQMHKRNIDWLLQRPQQGPGQPAGNQTSDPLVCRTNPNPLIHTSQGSLGELLTGIKMLHVSQWLYVIFITKKGKITFNVTSVKQ